MDKSANASGRRHDFRLGGHPHFHPLQLDEGLAGAGRGSAESKKNPEGWSASDKFKVVLERAGLNATDFSACFWELLHMEKINCSMTAKGCRWCNVEVESSFSTLKLELNLGACRT